MRCQFIFIFLFLQAKCLMCLSQVQEKFLNYQYTKSTASSASYYCFVKNEDSIAVENCYYTGTKTLMSKNYFKDTALRQIIKSYYYYPNQRLSWTSLYASNTSISVSYHYNGYTKDSSLLSFTPILTTDTLTNKRRFNRNYKYWNWHSNGNIADSAYSINDSVMIYRSWHDNEMPSSAGYLINPFYPIGEWKYYHPTGNLSSIILYDKKSKIIQAEYYDIEGRLLSDSLILDKPATFKKKKNAWSNYVDNNLYWPKGYKIINGDTATVVVNYTISNTGKVEDVYIAVPFNPAFDEIVVNLVKSSPRWNPRIECNRAIKETKSQTVTFSNKPK